MKHPDVKVSVVIPCYNQEKWIGEAIDSCLLQFNAQVETIVIDDGSTDKSLAIIKSYGNRILWETGPNRGVNPARNRGFELSTGKYVRFLDADDLLMKNIIQEEVRLLETSGADVCYGNWAHLKVCRNQDRVVSTIQEPGPQEDMILWLLEGFWCPPLVYLYKREFLKSKQLLWNIHLSFPDDFEFILRTALAGARFCCLPSLVGYYRQYSGPRLSKIKTMTMVTNTQKILELAERQLVTSGRFDEAYQMAVCNYYLRLAKNIYGSNIDLFHELILAIHRIRPSFQPKSKWYAVLVGLLGYEKVEALLDVRRRIRNRYIQEKF